MLYGKQYLIDKLNNKKIKVQKRYNYYNMKNCMLDFDKRDLPSQFKDLNSVLGWSAKAVDSLADRLIFDGFRNDEFGMMDIYRMNNADILFDSAILSALIGSCSFLYIAQTDEDVPSIQVIDGKNATGIIDPVTNMLTEGYAILSQTSDDEVLMDAYLLPYRTEITDYIKNKVTVIEHSAPYPLLVPIIYRPDADRPFGHSRISRSVMSIQNSAARSIKRSEISAFFYSYPQRYILGLSEDAEIDKWKAAMSSMLAIGKDDEGDHPVVGQFPQQSMTPYTEQIKMFASLLCGETGLILDDLGFVSENPSSADSIKAAHESLRLTARKSQRTFGTGFLNAGYLARCLMDGVDYKRNEIYRAEPIWQPIFEPDASMLSGLGDAIIKINQAVPDYLTADKLKELTGL